MWPWSPGNTRKYRHARHELLLLHNVQRARCFVTCVTGRVVLTSLTREWTPSCSDVSLDAATILCFSCTFVCPHSCHMTACNRSAEPCWWCFLARHLLSCQKFAKKSPMEHLDTTNSEFSDRSALTNEAVNYWTRNSPKGKSHMQTYCGSLSCPE